MVTQENALYQGGLWCSYELKTYDGHYKGAILSTSC